MELKLRHSVAKILNEILAMLLAVSIVLFSSSVVFLSCFQTQSFVKKNFSTYSSQTIDCVNAKLEELAKNTGFPEEAYKLCFDENVADMVFDKTISNISYEYSTDFSDDADIYNAIKANLTKYCYDNNIDVSVQSIADNSSLAIDAINEALGGESTSNITIMNLTKSKKMILLIVLPFIIIIACFVLIDIINKGRHRRLNYYGLGLSTAGAVLAGESLLALIMSYPTKFQFCENVIFDAAIGDITNFALKVCASFGFVCLAVGFVLLFNNYHYYLDKKQRQTDAQEHKAQMQSDYMLEYTQIKTKDVEITEE